MNLKVDGSNPLLSYASSRNVFFSLRSAVAGYFARLFITKIWLAFIRRTKKFRMPNFLLFGAFRRTLKIPGENRVQNMLEVTQVSWLRLKIKLPNSNCNLL